MKGFWARQVDKFNEWINAHGGPTKVGAATIIILGIAYGSVPQFHDLCASMWMALPTKIKTLCVTAFTLYSWLRNPATRKVIDGLLGPGDTVNLKNPVLDTQANTLSATSAVVTKATDQKTE